LKIESGEWRVKTPKPILLLREKLERELALNSQLSTLN